MIRKFGKKEDFVPVRRINDARYRINFDWVDDADENMADYGVFSLHDYFVKPTTEQMQEDVRDMTIQRYLNEGLTPPAREDIDVSAYVVDD